jgi:hypothetical protein
MPVQLGAFLNFVSQMVPGKEGATELDENSTACERPVLGNIPLKIVGILLGIGCFHIPPGASGRNLSTKVDELRSPA